MASLITNILAGIFGVVICIILTLLIVKWLNSRYRKKLKKQVPEELIKKMEKEKKHGK
jgi:predicted kinase